MMVCQNFCNPTRNSYSVPLPGRGSTPLILKVRAMYDHDGASGDGAGSQSAVWDMLGRGTPAGRRLFALYNGDNAGRHVGNDYSARNKRIIAKQREAGSVASGALAR